MGKSNSPLYTRRFNGRKPTALRVLVGILLVGGGLLIVLKTRNVKPSSPISPLQDVQISIFKKQEVPFKELTIPHLQSRSYESSLGELNEYSSNEDFTSYLTHYTSDGLRINGLLTIPNQDPPESGWPAVVFIHGYIPPQEYETTENYESYVEYLAGNGLVVFKIDLRGHNESEGEPGGAYYSGDYVIDALNAASALQSSGFVNENAVGLWGHSMAGNVVFRSLAASKDVKAVVIWAGAVYSYEDFQEYGISDNSYQPPSSTSPRRQRRQELFDTHGPYSKDSDFWSQVPATNYLNDVEGAVQIHHATNDPVVDIRYSRNLMEILDKTEIVHELYEYNSGGHNISGPAFTQAMQRTVEFFQRHLTQ